MAKSKEIVTYHGKFLLYLGTTSLRFKDGKCEELVKFAEEQLPAFLQTHGHPDFQELYSNLDLSFWNAVSTDSLPANSDEERTYVHNLMEVLKYYRAFLKFDKTANYKKLLADKIRREQQKKRGSDSNQDTSNYPDNCQPEEEGAARKEGAVSQVSVTKYERNPEYRRMALAKYGYICQVCGMNFESTYGAVGHDFIEVHHLYPVSNMGEDYHFDPLDPEKGLVPLCSNCHSMIHRGGHYEEQGGERVMVPLTLKELKDLYNKHKVNTDE